MNYLNESAIYGNNFTNFTLLPKFGRTSQSSLTYVLIVIYSLIFVAAVLGNVLVIFTLVHNKRMRTVTNVFLLNLAISDLLLAVFCMPFTLIPIFLKSFIFGPTMCVLIRYLQGKSFFLLLLLISMFLHINVREYLRGNQKRTIQRNRQHRVHKTKKNKAKTHHNMCWTPL